MTTTQDGRLQQVTRERRVQTRRVAAATLVGSAIEWYDFFIFATAASLVFAQLYFEPAGPQVGLLVSFASVGISFLFRPLGAFLAGHFGDRLGRQKMLIVTLVSMGVATTLIGLLPTYAGIGLAAPLLLLALRILQGLAAGGEWGGAALMAVEHAAPEHRGIMGSFPQLGVPLGLLLASGMTTMMAVVIAPGEAFLAWGWRVPFLFSVVLIVVGFWIRRAVEETPVFTEMAEKKKRESRAPAGQLFKRHGGLMILAALLFAGNGAAGYLTTGGFVTAFVTSPDREAPLERGAVLGAITVAGVFWFFSTLLGGYLADRIGRKRTTIIGFVLQAAVTVPFFWMIGSGSLVIVGAAMCLWYVVNGLTYGPLASWYAELFPASLRFTGVSLSYALGAVVGGAFAPMISTALVQEFGTVMVVAVYILVMTAVALVATGLLRDRQGIDLGIENEAEQERGATVLRAPLSR